MECKEAIEKISEWQEVDYDKRAVITLALKNKGNGDKKTATFAIYYGGSVRNIYVLLRKAIFEDPELLRIIRQVIKDLERTR